MVWHPLDDKFAQLGEVLAILNAFVCSAFMRIDKHHIDIRTEIQLIATEFSHSDYGECCKRIFVSRLQCSQFRRKFSDANFTAELQRYLRKIA